MSEIRCDLHDFRVADGPTQMALDDAFLERAAAGRAGLRFYGWRPATQSLGYFQKAAERLPGLPFVRRMTGGGAIVHEHDLTYALALPLAVYRASERPWPCRMHDAIRAALADFGVGGLACASAESGRGRFLCFEHVTPGDVMLGAHKVAGSAQRKRAEAVLIHGSVLLAASRFTPQLPGVRELSGKASDAMEFADVVSAAFGRDTGWAFNTADDELAGDVASFAAEAWNFKR